MHTPVDTRTPRPPDGAPGWPDVGRPVPRQVVTVAHLVPLTVLPAGIWRVVLGFGVTLGFSPAALEASDIPGWGTAWVVFLTLLTEGLALLTLGLVRPWGEVVPAWVPWLGGRRIPPAAVVVPATIGGLLLIPIWLFADQGLLTGRFDDLFTGGLGWRVLLTACYLPALLWGPLLLWVTYQYHRRRRGRSSGPALAAALAGAGLCTREASTDPPSRTSRDRVSAGHPGPPEVGAGNGRRRRQYVARPPEMS